MEAHQCLLGDVLAHWLNELEEVEVHRRQIVEYPEGVRENIEPLTFLLEGQVFDYCIEAISIEPGVAEA